MKKTKTATVPAGDNLKVELQPGESMRVPYAKVRPDPNQPRKTFNEAALKELADSIAQQGILQPLILELKPAKYKILEPDLHVKEYRVLEATPEGDIPWTEVLRSGKEDQCVSYAGVQNLTESYQIVCGERRWRAAGMQPKGTMDTIPAVVYRGLSDRQRFAMQFIENNQRENITALEEAAALQRQLEDRRKKDATFNKEKLAAELGMSRAAIFELFKLNRLHAPVRAALVAGKISVSVAGELAKVPTPKAQEKLLKKITDEKEWKFPFSVRDVQEIIEDDYVKQLDDAPFDTKLTYGDSVAGVLDACTHCPNRTGNQVDEFPELKTRPNVCTNPDCYAGKVRAYWLEQAKDEMDKGKTVLTEKEYKAQRATLTPVDEYIYPVGKNGTLKALLGKHSPDPILVATAGGMAKYFRKEDLPEAFTAAKLKFREHDASMQTPEEKAKAEAKRKEQIALGERVKDYLDTRVDELAKALPKLKPAVAFEVLELLLDGIDSYGEVEFETGPLEKLKDPQGKVLAAFFKTSGNDPWDCHEWQKDAVAAWKLAGIDLVEGFKASEKTAQPALVLPAKKAPLQPKLLKVAKLSPTAIARIKAAQRARWAKIKAKVK